MKKTAVFVVLGFASIRVSQGLDLLDPCIRSCYFGLLESISCTGAPEIAARCGCKAIERIWFRSPLTQCAEKNCSTSELPEALTSVASCNAYFIIDFQITSETLAVVTLRSRTTSSSSSFPDISTNLPANAPTNVLMDTATSVQTSITSIQTRTPISTSTTRTVNSPINAQTTTWGSIASTSPLISNPSNVLETTTASTTLSSPTTTPSPYSEGQSLSPGIISAIVVVTVATVMGIIAVLWWYRRRRYSRATSVKVNGASIREEKYIESVVPGYNELLGTSCCHQEVLILQLMAKLIYSR